MSEPVGWNVYYTGRHLTGEEWHRFAEFIPNEEVLGPVAEDFADEVEAFVSEPGP